MIPANVPFAEYVEKRRPWLRDRIVTLTTQINEAKVELASLDAVAKSLGLDNLQSQSSSPVLKSTHHIAPERTIKEYVREILAEAKDGLTANELLEVIADRYRVKFMRSSISPQLSRLKAEGELVRREGRWCLPKNDEKLADQAAELAESFAPNKHLSLPEDNDIMK